MFGGLGVGEPRAISGPAAQSLAELRAKRPWPAPWITDARFRANGRPSVGIHRARESIENFEEGRGSPTALSSRRQPESRLLAPFYDV